MHNKLVPQPFKRLGQEGRRRTLEAQPFAAHRMLETEDAGVQQDTVEALDPPPHLGCQRGPPTRPVETVAQKGVAEIRQMHPDLVGASRLQGHLEARRPRPRRLDHPIAGHRPLAVGHNRHALAVVTVAADRPVDHSPHRRRQPPDHRLVETFHPMQGELPGEADVGTIGLGHHQDTAHLAVETMDDARPGDATDAGEAVAAMGEEGVDEGTGTVAGSGVDHHARRLDQHQQMLVLEQDVEGVAFRAWRRRPGRRYLEIETLAVFDPPRRVGYRPPLAVQMTGTDQTLQARAGEFREPGREELVEPPAVVAAADLEGQRSPNVGHGGDVESWLRLVKIFVVVSGVVLVLGTGTLIALLVSRSGLDGGGREAGLRDLVLPDGMRLRDVDMGRQSVLLELEDEAGLVHLLVIDVESGRRIAFFRLVPAP